jgi:hypothetical protein
VISRTFRLLLRHTRVECDAFLHRLLSWDLDRAILVHGAKPAVERARRFVHTAVKQDASYANR